MTKRPSVKNISIFSGPGHVLQLPPPSKFESSALEWIYLKTLDHYVYKILVKQNNNGMGQYRTIDSRHVTCDESKLLGAPDLETIMDEENQLDSGFSIDQFCESDEKYGEDDEIAID